MDTTKLVVGQRVALASCGCHGKSGVVVKVTPDGVEVRADPPKEPVWQRTLVDGFEILHFDKEGNGLDDEGTYECGASIIDQEVV
jgi:hypothetical protein